MKLSIAIMAHHSRFDRALELTQKLQAQGFDDVNISIDGMKTASKGNEWRNGQRALTSHNDSDWHIVIQDDAIIGDNFRQNVISALENVPSKSLVSFYTGKVRPFKEIVEKAVKKACIENASWLSSKTLHWGVGIAVPTEKIAPLIQFASKRAEEYDRRIGEYFFKQKLPVYYTNPSLVDHDYTIGSLLGNDRSEEPRIAHRYKERDIENWNSDVIEIRF